MTWRIYALTIGQPNWRDDALQFLHAFFVGGDLRLDVGDVHVGAAGGIFCAGQQRAEFGFAEVAAIDQQEIVDDDAFFLQRAGHRRGGARGDAADIGVMAAAADEEQDVRCRRIEHRGNDGDIGQMRAAVERVVQRHDVARLQRGARGGRARCARSRPSRRDAPAHAARWPPGCRRRRRWRRKNPAVP